MVDAIEHDRLTTVQAEHKRTKWWATWGPRMILGGGLALGAVGVGVARHFKVSWKILVPSAVVWVGCYIKTAYDESEDLRRQLERYAS